IGLLWAALTTLSAPKHDIGTSVARMLLDRIRGRPGESEVLLKPELIVRESAPRIHYPSWTKRGGRG
ncbi:MAG: substrate-binding domain-containing protein, partial [Actinomycetota bacterium]|nr:substrate-binding domain-containing protein [Actinomycetota bacterium]